jgi:hypothetical protein
VSLQYKEVPRGLRKYLGPYTKALTKPQRHHFTIMVAGLVVHDNKTVQEINDAFSKKNQSSLNRSIKGWDCERLNELRLAHMQRRLPTRDDGLLIIDDHFAPKTGRQMEGAGRHRSGTTRRLEWGYKIVNSYCAHPDWEFGYPIYADIFTNKDNRCYEYRPIKRIGLELVRYAHAHRVRGVVCMDTLFYADYVIHELDDAEEDYLVGAPSTLKISVNRARRVSLAEYFSNAEFSLKIIDGKGYYISSVWASIRGVGVRRVVCSYRVGDEDGKFYVTKLRLPDRELLVLLVCRWQVECWHRDAKQHLGLGDSQVRKDRAVRNVALAVLFAYTALVLSLMHSTLRRVAGAMGRPLRTIGELCRFMRLAARRGWRWITRALRKRPELFREVLNREVVVKNAKV